MENARHEYEEAQRRLIRVEEKLLPVSEGREPGALPTLPKLPNNSLEPTRPAAANRA